MSKKCLTPKQERFVAEYVKTSDASRAYRTAYNTNTTTHAVHVAASKLMKNKLIKARLARLAQKVETRSILTAQQILEELTKLGTQKTLQARDKLKALELLGKYRKLFTERVEVKGADGTALVIASLSEKLKLARQRSSLVH
jgi:phage terminase small subunit